LKTAKETACCEISPPTLTLEKLKASPTPSEIKAISRRKTGSPDLFKIDISPISEVFSMSPLKRTV